MGSPAAKSYALLFAAFAWLAVAASEPLNQAVEHFRDHQPWADLRLVGALIPLILLAGSLLFAEKLGERSRQAILAVTLCLQIATMLEWCLRSYDPDEPVHLHFVWNTAHGWLAYHDYFLVRHLLWHLLCVPLILWFDNDLTNAVYAFKLATMVVTLGALFLAGRMVRMPLATAVLALGLQHVLTSGTEYRSDPPATLFTLAAVWLAWRNRPAAAGVAVGIAYLMIQKVLFAAAALGGAWLLCGRGIRGLIWFCAAFSGTAGLYFVWALWRGIPGEYWLCCYKCAAALSSKSGSSNALFFLWQHMTQNPLFWLLGLAGAAVLARRGDPFLPVATALTLLLLLMTKIVLPQYVLTSYLLMAMMGAVALGDGLPATGSKLLSAVPLVALLAVASLGLLRHAAVPPPGIDLRTPLTALQKLGPQDAYYSESFYACPIFRPQAHYYGHNQEQFARLLHGMALPHGFPGQLDWLPQSPPPMLVFPNPEREKAALGMMKDAGHIYVPQDGAWYRVNSTR